jgi:hypothetical protein
VISRRRRWRRRATAVPRGGAFLQLADNSLSDVAHRINRTHHLLLADHDLVEQAFELRG